MKIYNIKYGFYWMYIMFTQSQSQKIVLKWGTIGTENQNKNIIQGVHEHYLLLAFVIHSICKETTKYSY